MKREFIHTRRDKSGKEIEFALYKGILDQAHQEGLKRIEVDIIQYPSSENGHTAICRATVETSKGIFTDIGDASPSNVSSMVVAHYIRMASTRAKGRAMKDAINVGVTALDELEDDEPASPAPARQYQQQAARPAANAPVASAEQLQTLRDLMARLKIEQPLPLTVSAALCQQKIAELQQRLQKGGQV